MCRIDRLGFLWGWCLKKKRTAGMLAGLSMTRFAKFALANPVFGIARFAKFALVNPNIRNCAVGRCASDQASPRVVVGGRPSS